MATHKLLGCSRALLLLFFLAVPLIAQDANPDQEKMENSDFSDGTTHWEGDCRPAGTEMTTDPTASSASYAKGIVIDLHANTWTRVTQEIFNKKMPVNMVLTIIYQTSPDFKLSDRPYDYYGSVGPKVSMPTAGVGAPPGQLVAFFDEPPITRTTVSGAGPAAVNIDVHPDIVRQVPFTPTADGQMQTFTTKINAFFGNFQANPVFCLAIPPGNGSITLLNISFKPPARRQHHDIVHPPS